MQSTRTTAETRELIDFWKVYDESKKNLSIFGEVEAQEFQTIFYLVCDQCHFQAPWCTPYEFWLLIERRQKVLNPKYDLRQVDKDLFKRLSIDLERRVNAWVVEKTVNLVAGSVDEYREFVSHRNELAEVLERNGYVRIGEGQEIVRFVFTGGVGNIRGRREQNPWAVQPYEPVDRVDGVIPGEFLELLFSEAADEDDESNVPLLERDYLADGGRGVRQAPRWIRSIVQQTGDGRRSLPNNQEEALSNGARVEKSFKAMWPEVSDWTSVVDGNGEDIALVPLGGELGEKRRVLLEGETLFPPRLRRSERRVDEEVSGDREPSSSSGGSWNELDDAQRSETPYSSSVVVRNDGVGEDAGAPRGMALRVDRYPKVIICNRVREGDEEGVFHDSPDVFYEGDEVVVSWVDQPGGFHIRRLSIGQSSSSPLSAFSRQVGMQLGNQRGTCCVYVENIVRDSAYSTVGVLERRNLGALTSHSPDCLCSAFLKTRTMRNRQIAGFSDRVPAKRRVFKRAHSRGSVDPLGQDDGEA